MKIWRVVAQKHITILIFNITLRMVCYLNTIAKYNNMAPKAIFICMKCFVFYHPEWSSPSSWFCFQENNEMNFGKKKQTRSLPTSQTLKYKRHITFRNKTRQQNNHVYLFFISNFHNLWRVEFHYWTFRTVEFPI